MAYHYYMLAQNQLAKRDAYSAMITALRLCEYEDILDRKAIYSLLSVAALQCGYFETCSAALVKLETLPELTEAERDELQNVSVINQSILAHNLFMIVHIVAIVVPISINLFFLIQIKIFSTNAPLDPTKLEDFYRVSLESGKPYKACILTGR